MEEEKKNYLMAKLQKNSFKYKGHFWRKPCFMTNKYNTAILISYINFQHNYEKANESATGRKSTGLHFSTYRATVNRQGVFKSPSYGQINFNEDLTDPIYRCLTIVWDRVFR